MATNYNTKESEDLGSFTVEQWKKKREFLRINLNYSKEWEEAVDWYSKRLQIRYFLPMKRIEKHSIGEGFSLATIHCALIEHFASITEGKIYNYKSNKRSPKYEYSSSSDYFLNTLRLKKNILNLILIQETFTLMLGVHYSMMHVQKITGGLILYPADTETQKKI